jgi:hypothetical protein
MSRRSIKSTIALATTLTGLLGACNTEPTADRAPDADPGRVSTGQPGVHRQYGAPTKLGNARVRTYVVIDEKNGGAPLEVGVAFDENALEGLPAPDPSHGGGADGHEHPDMHAYDLPMPAQNPTPYKFVELDWNPAGHEIAGIYDVPHFDFHFYGITAAERNAILPSDPQFQQRADNLPAPEFRPAFYSTMTPPGAPTPAVPRMGVHWIDVRSPEIQALLGNPEAARPFTTTFIHGSWDGRFIFDEPMVTRAFILGRKTAATAAQRDSLIQLPAAERYAPAGRYPAAYRIMYDAQAKEYRIGLTQLTARQ